MTRFFNALVGLFCERPILALFLVLLSVGGGLYTTPLELPSGFLDDLPRDPVPVDAIPDLGENQQIVFTPWPGRSPQDVDDQVTYPLTSALLGLPGVRTVRSTSMFGFSSIYVIFEEGVEFYWSRSRILEKLSSLPLGTLPPDAEPQLGPDATALGQVFWYTLEGLDDDGNPAGGWDLEELRSIQDWQVKYALLAAPDVSEVASIGGYQREYQVDVDPDRLRVYGIGIDQVAAAVRRSNLDVGARTLEVNSVEYVVRGVGFLEELADIEAAVVTEVDGTPITVGQLATVSVGPAARRGALDKAGAEAVGGVVVVRYGSNPLAAIEGVREAAAKLFLPSKVLVDWDHATPAEVERYAAGRGFEAFQNDALELDQVAWARHLAQLGEGEARPTWLTRSTVTVVPFYDRTELIQETLQTLSSALVQQLLITFVVIGLLVLHLGGATLVGALLPLAVLLTFVAMRLFGIDANIVALSGIAIAIGTMVDMGIVITENIVARLDEARGDLEAGLVRAADVVREATVEVAGAVFTSVSTTVLSFLPVFAMTGAEGKLFSPLAATKTFALIASLVLALCLIPPAALVLFGRFRPRPGGSSRALGVGWTLPALVGLLLLFTWWELGLALLLFATWRALSGLLGHGSKRAVELLAILVLVAFALVTFAGQWEPLGAAAGDSSNLLFAATVSLGLLLVFWLFRMAYPRMLAFCLRRKAAFLLVPAGLCLMALWIWLGFGRVMAFVPGAVSAVGLSGEALTKSEPWQRAERSFPGIGSEFMPSLDEGMFLYMPTIAPHGSIREALEALALEDINMKAIPEVDLVVGKIGRADTPLDPAPVSMTETIISYLPEYREDAAGYRLLFAFDTERDDYLFDDAKQPVLLDSIPEEQREGLEGRAWRQWRDHIRSTDDIWNEIVHAAGHIGATSAPKLQPIETRLIMLQTGMRAPYGMRLFGPDLASLEEAGLALEELLKDTDGVQPSAVFADRVTGKPYLEIELDRDRLARHGIPIEAAQETIATAIGGMAVTRTVEGRERYPVRLRYPRELRDDPDSIGRVLLQSSRPDAAPVPLSEVAELTYTRGPQAIKAENARLVSYVLFDALSSWSETEVVESAQARVADALDSGELVLPPGVSFEFAGTWENQVRAKKTLSVLVPLVLLLILAVLVLEFRSLSTSLFIFSGVAVAWAGGFLLIWLYGQDGFGDVEVLGTNLRDLFHIGPIHLSVAVWVGFLALFGIATDDGVVMASYLRQKFDGLRAAGQQLNITEVRAAVVESGQRRVRPCLATTATTLLALLPVLGSSGRGAEVLVPMAIPAFGGMALELLTMFVLPVLWCIREEWHVLRRVEP
ncbi:MAG: efflux RND transporter permease subunit [Planctomycetota bacterium]|nr:efflux RND transporter permease subunit [Planctomycetota bacterium]